MLSLGLQLLMRQKNTTGELTVKGHPGTVLYSAEWIKIVPLSLAACSVYCSTVWSATIFLVLQAPRSIALRGENLLKRYNFVLLLFWNTSLVNASPGKIGGWGS